MQKEGNLNASVLPSFSIVYCAFFFKRVKKNSNMFMIITVPSKQQFDMFILHLLSIVVKFLLIE